MARITIEDCLKKIDSQYDLVLLAKERTSQLNAGEEPLVPKDNDKNTVISLREIGEGKVSVKNLEESAINKLRKQQEESLELDDLEDIGEDSFDKEYKGQVSKSGTAILPSKRIRRMPERIKVDQDLSKATIKETEEELSKELSKEENKQEEDISSDKKS